MTSILPVGFLARSSAITIAVVAGMAMASPASAGRCGHSYPVDAPTTLSKVARACNVSLSALREANPGVDPAWVRPGQHLAVPDETDYAGDVPAPEADVEPAYEPYYPQRTASRYDDRYNSYNDYYDDGSDDYRQARYTRSTSSSETPYYYQASVTSIPATRREQGHLSYQKESAQRIRNAGLPISPVRPATSPAIRQISLPTTGAPAQLSPLMECPVLRRQPDGKIRQVQEVKPIPDDRATPSHCVSFSASDDIKVTPGQNIWIGRSLNGIMFSHDNYAGLPSFDDLTMLKGYVSGVDAQCLTIRDESGLAWRVDMNGAADDLLGKEATIWVEMSGSKACGGLVMDHAVYVEQVSAR